MRFLWSYIQVLLFVCIGSNLTGQRFPCDGQLLIARNDGESTTILRPFEVAFNPPFLSPFSKFDGSFDALGFNSKDNYIYGVQENTNNIVRLKRNNRLDTVGQFTAADTLHSFAGDCTAEGQYICHDYKLNQLLVFDVFEDFQLTNRIDLFWSPNASNLSDFKSLIYDFAIDPNNPTVAYTYQGSFDDDLRSPPSTRNFILQINLDFNDPNLGMVTPLERIDQNIVGHLGGLIFSPYSELFGFGTESFGMNPPQNKLFSINSYSGDAVQVLAKNPAIKYSDGCSCPFSFTFTNFVPTEGMYCNNEIKTFTLQIDHNSYIPLENIILRDTLPEGLIIREVPKSFEGNITPGTGVGYNILEITELKIPPKSTVKIKIEAESIDAKVGPTYNQAFLENLPERYNLIMGSDDSATFGAENDPSCFFMIPRELEEISWTVTPPTDCIDANDAQIVFTSPQFFQYQEFEVGLRNKIGWTERVDTVSIDNNKSFLIDSLTPGDYQIFSLRSLSENCGLALKETTILVEAPNDLLMLDVSSNSPICDGETLLINSTVTSSAMIRLTGPQLYVSEDENSIIQNASSDQSGEYKVEANYGYCSQSKRIDIDVKPLVNVSVDGDFEYCSRDSIRLITNAVGQDLEFSWSFADSLLSKDSILLIPNINDNNAGSYQIIANNGACTDTASAAVLILPTPTLLLDNELQTDFCEAVILAPEVLGDTEVEYLWSPEIGLSCSDCSHPQLQPIVQSTYKLNIINEYQCRDSALINIRLDKKNILHTPNIFNMASRNGNHKFIVTPGCITNYIHSLDIFDRWGKRVYTAQSLSPNDRPLPWDGYIHSKRGGNGVYIWYAKIELIDGSIQYLTGDVTLLGN